MKTPLTVMYRRRKFLASAVRGVSSATCLLVLLALLSHIIFAQSAEQPVAPPESASLPRAFAQFSASDVLKQIFDGYDSKTGRVSGVHNLEGKPALVAINKAALWKVQGQEHLVVLVDIAGDNETTGLCGNCFANSFLAVLKKNGAALSLVARQFTPPADAPVEYESLDEDQLIQYSGHDELTLDLAPYKLNGRETLIGVRQEHIWLPAWDWSTSLTLYRIVDGHLKEVLVAPVVAREYSDAKGNRAATIEKTTSTISFVPASKGGDEKFNDLVINKIVVRCPNKSRDDDCDSKHAGFKQIKTLAELWRFDGRRYVQVMPVKR